MTLSTPVFCYEEIRSPSELVAIIDKLFAVVEEALVALQQPGYHVVSVKLREIPNDSFEGLARLECTLSKKPARNGVCLIEAAAAPKLAQFALQRFHKLVVEFEATGAPSSAAADILT